MAKISEEEYLARASVGIQLRNRFKLKAVPRIVYYREEGEIWVEGKQRKKDQVLLLVNAIRKITNGKCKGQETRSQFYLAIPYKKAKKLSDSLADFFKKHKGA